jgi:YD repeat-containing protein
VDCDKLLRDCGIILRDDASNNVLRSRSYSYTLAGMISRVTMESGEKVDYSYDSLDRLTAEKRFGGKPHEENHPRCFR